MALLRYFALHFKKHTKITLHRRASPFAQLDAIQNGTGPYSFTSPSFDGFAEYFLLFFLLYTF